MGGTHYSISSVGMTERSCCERAADPLARGGFVEPAGHRDLAVAQVGDIAQDERFTLAGFELLERIAERARAPAAARTHRALRLPSGHDLEQLVAATPRLEHVRAHVPRDPAQPRLDRSLARDTTPSRDARAAASPAWPRRHRPASRAAPCTAGRARRDACERTRRVRRDVDPRGSAPRSDRAATGVRACTLASRPSRAAPPPFRDRLSRETRKSATFRRRRLDPWGSNAPRRGVYATCRPTCGCVPAATRGTRA